MPAQCLQSIGLPPLPADKGGQRVVLPVRRKPLALGRHLRRSFVGTIKYGVRCRAWCTMLVCPHSYSCLSPEKRRGRCTGLRHKPTHAHMPMRRRGSILFGLCLPNGLHSGCMNVFPPHGALADCASMTPSAVDRLWLGEEVSESGHPTMCACSVISPGVQHNEGIWSRYVERTL